MRWAVWQDNFSSLMLIWEIMECSEFILEGFNVISFTKIPGAAKSALPAALASETLIAPFSKTNLLVKDSTVR
ncbi:hypothetical protein CFS9_37140 [Flavobacterium sp. CFS9]|uniref:Uncharacterized protein n=1 Tax=Flavobacterium sp. CFS9 TaxID=3143118 RepID=A0AAT9H691_9FLAO